MPSRIPLYFTVLLALCCALAHAATANINAPAPPSTNLPAGLREILTLEDGTRIQVEEFPGVSKLAFLKHMFTSSTVHVRCPGYKDFSVFHGRSVEDVREAYGRGEKAWCGWERFMGRSAEVCIVPVPVFDSSYVAVAKPKSWLSGRAGALVGNLNRDALASSGACSMTRIHELSVPRLLSALMGAFFFSAAPQLAENTPFRLAGGSIGFAALSSLIVLFVLYRSLPQRRSFVFGSVLFGSTVAAAIRYIFGTWLPSFNQLIKNPIVLGYTALSALMGLAMTYYFNDTSNHKINIMLRVALQLSGLGMLAGSASSKEGAVFNVFAVIAWRLVPLFKQERSMIRVLRRAKDAVQHDFQGSILVEEQPLTPLQRAAAAFASTPRTPPAAGAATAEATPFTAAGRAVAGAVASATQVPSPLVERGLILNVETGKTIQIGKGTYNKLRDDGYDVDFINGTITPPGARGGGGSGSGGVSGASGGAVSRGRKSVGGSGGGRGRSASAGKKKSGGGGGGGTPRSKSRRKE
ncbi:hypothetical protein Ndes2437B_g08496 [Nannochloris sp. 'desiccata']